VFIGHRRNNNDWGGGEVPPPPTTLDALEPFARFVASKGGGGGSTSPPPQLLLLRRWPINTTPSACDDHLGPGDRLGVIYYTYREPAEA